MSYSFLGFLLGFTHRPAPCPSDCPEHRVRKLLFARQCLMLGSSKGMDTMDNGCVGEAGRRPVQVKVLEKLPWEAAPVPAGNLRCLTPVEDHNRILYNNRITASKRCFKSSLFRFKTNNTKTDFQREYCIAVFPLHIQKYYALK